MPSLRHEVRREFPGGTPAVAWVDDATLLVGVGHDGAQLVLWRWAEDRTTPLARADWRFVSGLAVGSVEGRAVAAVGGPEGQLGLVDLVAGTWTWQRTPHGRAVTACVILAASGQIVSVAGDGTARWHRAEDGARAGRLAKVGRWPRGVTASRDEGRLAVVHQGGHLVLGLPERTKVEVVEGRHGHGGSGPETAAFGPDGDLALAQRAEPQLRRWSGPALVAARALDEEAFDLAWSGDGAWMVVGHRDRLRLVDAADLQDLDLVPACGGDSRHSDAVRGLAVAPSGGAVVTTDCLGGVSVFRVCPG